MAEESPTNPLGAGRPSLKTKAIVEILIGNRRLGLNIKTCCELAGVDTTTVYKWIKHDKDFSAKWNDATGQIIKDLHVRVTAEDPWKILKNLEPAIYRDKIETELSSKDGDPIILEVRDYRGQKEKDETKA